MNEMSPGLRLSRRQLAESPPEGPPAEGYSGAGGGFGLPEILGLVRRRLRLILSLFLLVLVGGVAFTMLQTPKYTATTLLMINPKQDRVVSEQQALTESSPDSAFVDSEIEVLKSPELAARLIRVMQLEEDPEWNAVLREPGPLDGMRSVVSAALSIGRQPADEIEMEEVPDVDIGVLRAVQEAISVRRRGLSYVMEVSVESGSPAKSAKMANALADMYLKTQVEAQFESADQANTWLTGRLEELKVEVQEKEAAAQRYRAEKGLLTAQGVSLTEQQIAEVQTAVLTARAEYAEKQARYEQVQGLINAGGSADTIANVLTSEVIRDLRAREGEVAQRQADLENRYGPMHPAIEKVRLEREDIDRQLKAEVSRIAANLQNEAQVVRSRLGTLESNLAQVRGNLVANNSELVRLNELETDARAAREVYESFLQRFHEVSQQGNLAAVEARVVSKARPPRSPSSPNLSLAFAIFGVLGVGAGAGAALVAEQFRNTLNSAEEVEAKVGVPAIASIPILTAKELGLLAKREQHPAGYLVKKPMSAFAESFRVLRTSVMYSMSARKHRVVAITSALPNEGKTTLSLSLARVSAMSGQKVLLVDCDLRRRSVNEVLGIAPKIGLLQVLSGEAKWQDVVGRDDLSGAHILPVADGGFTPVDVFGMEAMDKLMEELRAVYDVVILDCAPVLAVAETRVVVTHADAVVMTCRWGKTPAKAVDAAIGQLETTGAAVMGVALNCVDPKVPGRSSYYEALYYSKSEKSYYLN